jgi:hypothetical protein
MAGRFAAQRNDCACAKASSPVSVQSSVRPPQLRLQPVRKQVCGWPAAKTEQLLARRKARYRTKTPTSVADQADQADQDTHLCRGPSGPRTKTPTSVADQDTHLRRGPRHPPPSRTKRTTDQDTHLRRGVLTERTKTPTSVAAC